MDTAQLRQALDDVFDQAVVYHAYTDYMRDYEVIVYATSDSRTGIPPAHLRYLFKYCVQADTRTTLRPETWRVSLDDRLTDARIGPDLDGYVWAVRWQALYPGARLITDSARARDWAERIGIDFHEICFEMNGQYLTLIFHDLEVTDAPIGYTPYTITADQ